MTGWGRRCDVCFELVNAINCGYGVINGGSVVMKKPAIYLF